MDRKQEWILESVKDKDENASVEVEETGDNFLERAWNTVWFERLYINVQKKPEKGL